MAPERVCTEFLARSRLDVRMRRLGATSKLDVPVHVQVHVEVHDRIDVDANVNADVRDVPMRPASSATGSCTGQFSASGISPDSTVCAVPQQRKPIW